MNMYIVWISITVITFWLLCGIIAVGCVLGYCQTEDGEFEGEFASDLVNNKKDTITILLEIIVLGPIGLVLLRKDDKDFFKHFYHRPNKQKILLKKFES